MLAVTVPFNISGALQTAFETTGTSTSCGTSAKLPPSDSAPHPRTVVVAPGAASDAVAGDRRHDRTDRASERERSRELQQGDVVVERNVIETRMDDHVAMDDAMPEFVLNVVMPDCT
jgi:hypothetical protein|tara:strand:+ start:2678 stop:3028 length:351 start_codon:yes stop_codon:yes gene_type:complete